MNYSLENKEQFIAKDQIIALLDRHMADNNWKSVLLLPPDITRSLSGAGLITAHYYKCLTEKGVSVKVLPALGTHLPMTEEQLREMFGDGIPMDAYIAHDFRNSIEVVGTVPGTYLDFVCRERHETCPYWMVEKQTQQERTGPLVEDPAKEEK